MPHTLIGLLLISMLFASAVIAEDRPGDFPQNRYTQTNFVANTSSYTPTLAVDKRFIDAWGISIRPKGAGGHFWVTAKDISYEYVGDVAQSANPKLRKMHQDELKIVKLPVGGNDKFATGTVFNGSDEHFVITQEIKGAKPITAPAKFLFASDGGVVSAWTERKNLGGNTEFPPEAITVIDQSAEGAQFFGLAISHDYDTLYVADFGAAPAIKVFDGAFASRNVHFELPFDENENGKVDAGEFAPFNVQALTTPAGDHHIFVTYAKTLRCPKAQVKRGVCKTGEIFAGEEDTSNAGYGRLAEFTEDGELVKIWADGGKLSAPWGLAFAPTNFGKLSGSLLVSNFGDGTIAAFDANSTAFVDVLRSAKGKPVVIEKIWGLLFGNGESLGDSNALYFAAGPNDELDGVFGSLRAVKP